MDCSLNLWGSTGPRYRAAHLGCLSPIHLVVSEYEYNGKFGSQELGAIFQQSVEMDYGKVLKFTRLMFMKQ